jgi:hypothetical protein
MMWSQFITTQIRLLKRHHSRYCRLHWEKNCGNSISRQDREGLVSVIFDPTGFLTSDMANWGDPHNYFVPQDSLKPIILDFLPKLRTPLRSYSEQKRQIARRGDFHRFRPRVDEFVHFVRPFAGTFWADQPYSENQPEGSLPQKNSSHRAMMSISPVILSRFEYKEWHIRFIELFLEKDP